MNGHNPLQLSEPAQPRTTGPKPLSCIRCKTKKLRCDRKTPCDRCTIAGAVCATAERKPRASQKAKDKDVIRGLNHRIELLERTLRDTSAPLDKQSDTSPASAGATPPLTEASSDYIIGGEWLGKELREAKDYSVDHLRVKGELSGDSPVSQAMEALDGAMSDLGLFYEIISDEDPKAVLTKEEAKTAVQTALETMKSECFLWLVDSDLLTSVGDVMASTHVHVDPAVKVIYYNLLFNGYSFTSGRTRAGTRALYLQCLAAVPQWQKEAKAALPDLAAASILTWSTAISFDYSLAWQFHTQACRIAKQLGFHQLDVVSTKASRQDEVLNQKRRGLWQLVIVDFFFRLCYNKPSCISSEASTQLVEWTAASDVQVKRPRASWISVHMIWGRITFILKDYFDLVDQTDATTESPPPREIEEKAESICDEIEAMIADWHLVGGVRFTMYLITNKRFPVTHHAIMRRRLGEVCLRRLHYWQSEPGVAT
jgi:hypothetical protein